jgi:hypothetical protein
MSETFDIVDQLGVKKIAVDQYPIGLLVNEF